jgi:tetratricopeptide (TPR) repeat protein
MDVYAECVAPPAPPRRVNWKRTTAAGSLAAALTLIVSVIALPRDVDPVGSRVQSALALYSAGDRDGAQLACDEVLRTAPEEPRAWLVSGLLAEDRGDLAKAGESYRRAYELSPQDLERRREIEVSFAELKRRGGDPKGALGDLAELPPGVGDPVRLMHARALCLIDLGRFDEALNQAARIAESPLGAGVARRLERDVRTKRDAPTTRGG